jgi:hypothetical protein
MADTLIPFLSLSRLLPQVLLGKVPPLHVKWPQDGRGGQGGRALLFFFSFPVLLLLTNVLFICLGPPRRVNDRIKCQEDEEEDRGRRPGFGKCK